MIEHVGLVIRTIEPNDLTTIKKWYNPVSRGPYLEAYFKSMHSIEKDYEKDGFISTERQVLFIEHQSKGVGLIFINFEREGVATLGLGICEPEFRNSGLGTTITALIVDYLFSNHPVVRIQADCDLDNIGAQKVLTSVGFLREGVLRNYRFHHGQWHSSVMYSILRGELQTPLKR